MPSHGAPACHPPWAARHTLSAVAPSSQKAGCTQQYQMEVAHTWLGLRWLHRLSYTKKSPTHSQFLLQYLLTPSLFPWPQGLFPPILWQRKKIQAWFTAVFLFPQDTQASQWLCDVPFWGNHQEGCPWKKSLLLARTSQHAWHGVTFAWNDQTWDSIESCRLWLLVWLDGQRLGRDMIGNLVAEELRILHAYRAFFMESVLVSFLSLG